MRDSTSISSEPADASPAASRREARRPKRRSVTLRDWLLTIVVALTIAMFIRGFLIEAFRIPTSSMEKTLLAGDFVIVSKLHYGPRLPDVIGIPFTSWYIPGIDLPDGRMPGFSDPDRGDVIVFNYPLEHAPVGRKTHYIKRIVGMPGDTLSILNKVPYANGRPVPLMPEMQQKWLAIRKATETFPIERLTARGVEEVGRVGTDLAGVSFQSTVALAQEVSAWREIESIQPLVVPAEARRRQRVFPEGSSFGRDNYGPLYVPARGDVLWLTQENLPAYKDIIERHEGHRLSASSDGTIRIDGRETDRYIVEQDYFFVMGDNRDSSYDSRIWGFVPWDHVVGRATTIYFSWDQEQMAPRFERMFSAVN